MDSCTNDLAAEYVDDHVQVVEAPSNRGLQVRDIPGPYLVGTGCHKLVRSLASGRL